MTDKRWRPRAMRRKQMHRREDGRSVLGFGVRVGYWPCLRAPFLRIDFGTQIVELWCGWRSYAFDPNSGTSDAHSPNVLGT